MTAQGRPFDGHELLAHHRQALLDSGITPEVISERGSFSATTFKEARDLGFTQSQALTPALVIPLHTADGEPGGYLLRPDTPRAGADGKVVKYEQRRGKAPVLDVPPRVRERLGDPETTLYITEGAKKADALASHGVCVINLSGVWNWRGTNTRGGKTALPDWELVALNERKVRVVFDSDVVRKPAVAKALTRLTRFLEMKQANVEVVYLPDTPDGRKQGVDDFLVAGGTMESLVQLISDVVEVPSEPSEAERPIIITTDRHLDEVSEDSWRALCGWAARGHPVFQRGDGIVVVRRDEDRGSYLHQWQKEDVVFVLERAAYFMREVGIFDQVRIAPDRIPRDVVDDMLVAWNKPLPKLRRLVNMPVFTREGCFDTRPGYQAESLVYHAPVGEPVPAVPDSPTELNVDGARAEIDDWLHDFPFDGAASRAHAIAAVLTPLVREMFDGPTPLFAVDAPTQGTGKGLFCQTLGIIVSGSPPAVTTMSRDTDEERKRYTALLKEGANVILIDNVKVRLDSPVLAAALTADIWSDRILGITGTVRVPNRALWLATGNNLQFDGEIGRRTVQIRLDSRRDKPWERTGFRHSPLGPWVRDRRHVLVHALAVLVRRWVAAGRPTFSGLALGSFESWSEVVGGILETAGIHGFLTNRDELMRRSDDETEDWRNFVQAWWEEFNTTAVKAGDLAGLVKQQELLPGLRATLRDGATDQALLSRIGRAINARRDRRIGELFIRCLGHDKHAKGTVYALAAAEPEPAGDGGSAEAPHDNRSSADSFAEGAELAEPDPDPRAHGGEFILPITLSAHEDGRGIAKEAPQAPQAPHSGSNAAWNRAEPPAEPWPPGRPEAPQPARCRGCGMALSVVAVSDRCGRCQRTGGAR